MVKNLRLTGLLFALLLTLSAFAIPFVQADTCGDTSVITRASLTNGAGQKSEGGWEVPEISGDGRYVVFVSSAPGNSAGSLFVYDRLNCTSQNVSLAPDGAYANNYTPYHLFGISGDGRFVVFDSKASNLVPDDTNEVADVFLHDVETGTTIRISKCPSGEQRDVESSFPTISGDGNTVVFGAFSSAIPGCTGGRYTYDRLTGQVTRLEYNSFPLGSYNYYLVPISYDGRYIATPSERSDLVPGDTNNQIDTFVYDRQLGTIARASVASDGTQANQSSDVFGISDDGRYVIFLSVASNLDGDDTNLCIAGLGTVCEDLFVHDMLTGLTTRASVDSNGIQGNGRAGLSDISADGRIIVFSSDSTNLVSDDTNNVRDVFIYDTVYKHTTRISVSATGQQGNGFSGYPRISADGQWAVFYSEASNLVPGDTNGQPDDFVVRVLVPPITPDIPPLNYFTAPNVTLTWTSVFRTASYFLQMDDEPTFTAPHIFNGTIPALPLYYNLTVPGNGFYYWRIRGQNVQGIGGQWSAVQTFLVELP